jgi:tyrosyl-tRNA synthetase
MNFIEELRWRGMLQDIMPGTEEELNKGMRAAYIGFDPTADSLHVGSLVQIMILKFFQMAGHQPIVLVGGATGLIGDPSGKKDERKLLTEDEVNSNAASIKKQLSSFLEFEKGPNAAQLVNNADWFKNISTIEFLREAGKYLTVSYLLSKGFIKDRLSQDNDISFTEFNYILMQAYDFMWLFQHKNCKLQMGGSDQWGNITAGAELIRKKLQGEAYGLTCKLLTKSDGTKFGKTEQGNVWLDPAKTSPYQFYQFWLNASDTDAEKWIRIFTFLDKEETDAMIATHRDNAAKRSLQKKLAEEVTRFVHGASGLNDAIQTSEKLFAGQHAAAESLSMEDLENLEGVVKVSLPREKLSAGLDLISLLADGKISASKGEARKLIAGGGISINRKKADSEKMMITASILLHDQYLLVQKGKKNYFLVRFS